MKSSRRSDRMRRQTHGCQSAHRGTDTLGTLDNPNTSVFDRPLLPNDAHLLEPLKKTLTDEDTETGTDFPHSSTGLYTRK
ncbi:hypothetical protein AVEN_182552-1 [Araneus ventricosus]|uniref:Uncharacterized protein n=1 Tax=Araneus ventricosus TaxID=182803 RepID=A0A4Y2BY41_ARAVE|nr:hypothetical protein AVEN_182552-1 [Araneus ventricosus]